MRPFVKDTFKTVSHAPGRALKRWEMKGLDITVRHFCKRCNNAWMSGLEAKAKPLLIPMILGQNLPVALSLGSQRTLACWAYKTALVADFHLREAEPEEDPPIPISAYRSFYRSRVPPKRHAAIWTGAYVNPPWTVWARRVVHTIEYSPRLRQKDVPSSQAGVYAITISLGHLVFQVVGRLSGLRIPHFSDSKSAGLLRVWPISSGAISWPGAMRYCVARPEA